MTSDSTTAERAAGKRVKRLALLGILVGVGLALLAWSQPWFSMDVLGPGGAETSLTVGGGVAAPALLALSLASLALLLALMLSGIIFRGVFAVLGVVLGLSIGLHVWQVVGDAPSAAAPAITELTGVSGQSATSELVIRESITVTVWPWVALIGAVLLIAASVFVFVTNRKWPVSARKYEGVRMAPADRAKPISGADAAIGDWDALSQGLDPSDDDDDTGTGEPPQQPEESR